MARGYLGKISAIVSANTGNYVRGLDESARRTAAFAKTIQSDLRNASRDASKSIDAILTPLQRVERALQNARSQRLSFRGFDGAIRTVEDLRKRIGSLELGDRELAVRVSGLRSVDALNRAIEGLRQEDIDLAIRVGGVDGIRRLRQQVQEVNGEVINVQTGRSAANLDLLIDKFQTISAQRIQQVQIAVETAQLDRAEVAFKRTASVATQIAAPLGAAVQQLTTLSAGVQTAFGPALQIAQRAVENLGKTIEANGRISDNTFERTAQRVERTTQAINRLSEASRIAASAATGVELGFVAPRVRQELTASAATRNAAAESADPSRFTSQVQQLSQLNNLIVEYEAKVEERRVLGLDTTQAQRRLDNLLETNRRAREELGSQVNRDLSIVQTPTPQRGLALFGSPAGTDEEQALARARKVSAEFEKLPLAAQAGLRGLAGIASSVANGVQAGTANAVQLNAVLDRLSKRVTIEIDTSVADARVKALDELLNRVFGRENIANIESLQQSIQKLSLANQLNLGEAVEEFRGAIASGKDYEEQLKRLLAVQERLSVAQAIESLPEGSDARRRLQERFDREGAGPPPPGSPPLPADVASAQQRTDLFNLPVEDSVRRLGVLQGAINSVKGQVDQLPIPLQARFVPLLSQAEAEFQRLKNSGTATAAEIAKAARNVESLKNSVTRAADAGRILSASQVRASADTARALGEIGAAARLLTTIGAGPGDAASRAYDRLAAATRKFAREGTLGTAEVRKELQRLQEDAARAAAATGRISFGAALKQIQRGGDVATGAVNNAGLAAQQALFIVDDFFSVTGDLTQRIRAIGNNITQLGLIIGQTQGLFIALGVSLGLQVTAQLIKFFNAGVEGADKSRALNEALQKQKTIVDQLADSFRNLSRSFTLDAFQGGARSAEEFRRQIEELRKQQQDVSRERAASLDPEVNRERAIQQARRRDLERARNPGQIVAIQREIEQSQARERVAAARAAARPAPTTDQIVARLAGQVERQEETSIVNRLGIGDFESGLGGADRAAAQAQAQRIAEAFADELRQQIAAGASAEDVIRQRIDTLTQTRRTAGFLSGQDIGLIETQLQDSARLLADVQRGRVEAENEAQIAVLENLRAFGIAITKAQDTVDEAIRQGIPGSVLFSKELIDSAKAVSLAEQALTTAQRNLDNARALPENTAEERKTRREAIEEATRLRGEAQRGIEAAQRTAGRLEERAFTTRRRLFVDPQVTTEATLSRARDNLRQAGASDGVLARQLRELEFRRDELARTAADSRTTDAQREAINRDIAAVNASIDATEAASRGLRAFTEALSRSEQIVESNVQSARQRLDQAREQELALPSARNAREREIAERALRDQERAARAAREVFDIEREQLAERSRDPASALFDTFQELNRIENQLLAGAGDQAERERLISRRAELEGIVARAVRESPEVRAAEDQTSRLRLADALAVEGRALARTPAQAAAVEFADSINKINAEFNRQQAALIDEVANAALIQQPIPDEEVDRRAAGIELVRQQVGERILDQAIRQQAPLVAQFSDEVANAVLQGPSRAALQASDASTVEGQRELNRLLRGDDPARDVNLLELQKQTDKLTELIAIARENGVVIANQ